MRRRFFIFKIKAPSPGDLQARVRSDLSSAIDFVCQAARAAHSFMLDENHPVPFFRPRPVWSVTRLDLSFLDGEARALDQYNRAVALSGALVWSSPAPSAGITSPSRISLAFACGLSRLAASRADKPPMRRLRRIMRLDEFVKFSGDTKRDSLPGCIMIFSRGAQLRLFTLNQRIGYVAA